MRNMTRRKSHKVRKDRLFTFFAFFVLAPLISIVLGFGLVKYIILPRFLPVQQEPTSQSTQIDNSDNSTEYEQNMQESSNIDQDTQTQNIQLKQSKAEGITLYNVQVGNFNSMENAQSLAEELTTIGIPGYIVKLDSFNVFIGTYLSREEADERLSKVKDTYSDAFINTFSVIERVISYNENEESVASSLIDVIYAFDNAYKNELSLWSKAIETKDIKAISDTMTSNTNNLEIMIKNINTGFKSDKLVQLAEDLQNHILQRKNIVNGFENINAESLNKSYIDFNNNYFEYVSFTK